VVKDALHARDHAGAARTATSPAELGTTFEAQAREGDRHDGKSFREGMAPERGRTSAVAAAGNSVLAEHRKNLPLDGTTNSTSTDDGPRTPNGAAGFHPAEIHRRESARGGRSWIAASRDSARYQRIFGAVRTVTHRAALRCRLTSVASHPPRPREGRPRVASLARLAADTLPKDGGRHARDPIGVPGRLIVFAAGPDRGQAVRDRSSLRTTVDET
jgi:hypothetical protein